LEGDPPLDAPFLPYRRLVVLGYVGAVFNSRAITGQDVLDSSNLLLELTEREQPLTPWGEGAWNFVLQIAVALSRSPTGQIMGQAIASQWLTYACPAKGPWPKDPYWSVLDQVSVARRRSTVIDDTHERMKLTYSVDSALGYLVRRLWRQPVRLSWPSISRFSTAELVCDDPTEYLQWRTKSGSLLVTVQPLTGSWASLRDRSSKQRSALFQSEDSWLLPYFLCVYPHRVSPRMSGELDYLAGPPGLRSEWTS